MVASMRDPIFGGPLKHGNARLKKLDAMLKKGGEFMKEHPDIDVKWLYSRVWEARQLEAARIGRKSKG